MHLVIGRGFVHDWEVKLPNWAWTAKWTYRVALGAFTVLWLGGAALNIDLDDSQVFYVTWVAAGALGLVALLAWLLAEFLTGRREREFKK
jgi:hypothetical protein